jgi:hypothetical protein
VTAGVSINHLSLNENDIGEYRTFFRLSPPLRHEDDRLAMVGAEGRHDRRHRLLARPAGRRHQAAALLRTPPMARSGLKRCWRAALGLSINGDVPLIAADGRDVDGPAQMLGIEAGTLQPARVPISPCSTSSIRGCSTQETTSCRSRRTPPSTRPGSAAGSLQTVVAGQVPRLRRIRALQPAFKGGRTRRAHGFRRSTSPVALP